MAGTPTPTQAEADAINIASYTGTGTHPTLADDGSGPDPSQAATAQPAKAAEVRQSAPPRPTGRSSAA